MAKNPATVAGKWATNLAAAGPSITAGVNAVTEAPGARAAAARDLYLSGVQQNVDKWAANVGRVTLQEWKDKTNTLGGQRIASGAQAAIPKMTSFLNQFLPFQEGITNQTRNMAKGSLAASGARMLFQMNETAKFRRS